MVMRRRRRRRRRMRRRRRRDGARKTKNPHGNVGKTPEQIGSMPCVDIQDAEKLLCNGYLSTVCDVFGNCLGHACSPSGTLPFVLHGCNGSYLQLWEYHRGRNAPHRFFFHTAFNLKNLNLLDMCGALEQVN